MGELQSAPRTGPVGRLARIALAIAFLLTFLSIFDWRHLSARFRNPHILTEPSAWLLHGLMFIIFVILVGALAEAFRGRETRIRWQALAVAIAVVSIASAGIVGAITRGSVWGFPLADLVWWFDILVIIEQLLALALAVALGTPGCEIGVWPELVSRIKGTAPKSEHTLSCIIGLHLIDSWEARRHLRVG